jgi:AcrR family transcriptional regulator
MVVQVTARARVREEITDQIKQVARRQLAEYGSAGLSVRAVARELGMVSSAVYRYFPSRDELLSALIADARAAVADLAEAAESAVRRPELLSRWLAAARTTRDWALAHPSEYALLFGGPVAGTPHSGVAADSVGSAVRIPLLVAQIVADATAHGAGPAADGRPIPRAVRADLRALRTTAAPALSEYQLAHALLAWTQLLGSISSEVFGQLHTVVTDHQSYFDYQMQGIGRRLGLSDRSRPARPIGD